MDGTANAGRKGIAYLRDYYQPPPAVDAVATDGTDDERPLVASAAWQQ